MAKNWAIAIGINDYEHHPERKLSYAVNDAQRMHDFLCGEAGFPSEQVILCLGDAGHRHLSTYPTTNTLFKLLNRDFHPHQIGSADRLWFFFSGHGISRNGRDYLIPCDSFEEDSERFILPIDEVIAALRRHKTAEIVLVLDACRQLIGSKSAGGEIGEQTVEVAKQQSVTTIFSCSYRQSSYENQTLQAGSFTYALLEGLRQHTIPEKLEPYLQRRVQELNQQDGKSTNQTPIIRPEPGSKYCQPLLPNCTPTADLAYLKQKAIQAFADEDLETAEQLWASINELAINSSDRQLSLKMLKQILRQTSMRTGLANTSILINNPVGAGSADASAQPPAPSSKPAPTDDLSSEKGIDYTRLRDLLKAGKWKEADQETAERMCEVMGRQKEGFLRVEDIKAFPCVDLGTIDQLWVKYSNGHFGFSVQKKIWEKCGSPTDYGKNWDKFCDTVGWQVQGKYISYSDLKFDPSFSLEGELPGFVDFCGAVMGFVVVGEVSFGLLGLVFVSSLAQRLADCSMSQS
ncbi:MAG TPA: GUN4 domain-containing protein [Leptolyngbyaceae cyanobacterium M33_DOE_097]|uniref:Uncharacterized protein n=1 Tax=Oscillatoriales cyanobacterium SpSt-418 TaxID=2282169 RepID=A0A7C3PFG1_9CYAN|nr:GUN4 domain-containing protein [Leptolyngbyaceae cyanobacterium M33_DOE_097]